METTTQSEIESAALAPAQTPVLPEAPEQNVPRAASSPCLCFGFRTMAFTIPFVVVTAYSLSQSNVDCQAHGAYACPASAVIIGTLAGLTSMGLTSAIKADKRKRHMV